MNLEFAADALDVLCPMHVVLCHDGRIVHAGPTLKKTAQAVGQELIGQSLFDVFDIRRPVLLDGIRDLRQLAHQKLRLRLIAPPHTSFKGIMIKTGGCGQEMIMNLSFGMSILEGVREFSLTNADFAATDLALELMYLVEAKTAAMEASFKLNARLQGARIAAEEQAFTDTLTGLKNRRALDTVLTRLIDQGSSFALMQIDLDYFKTVNDTLGHAAGDHVLQTVARVMVDETRGNDMVARVGGDEFTVVLPDVRSDDILRRVGRRIIERLEEPIPFQGEVCRISASIGTVWIQSGQSPRMEDLLADADVALYASKHAGRAMQTLYHPDLRTAANAVGPPDAARRSP
jgi:diguanylate cyclase (GGDEF)-like protein